MGIGDQVSKLPCCCCCALPCLADLVVGLTWTGRVVAGVFIGVRPRGEWVMGLGW